MKTFVSSVEYCMLALATSAVVFGLLFVPTVADPLMMLAPADSFTVAIAGSLGMLIAPPMTHDEIMVLVKLAALATVSLMVGSITAYWMQTAER